jgi:hypothetical protein
VSDDFWEMWLLRLNHQTICLLNILQLTADANPNSRTVICSEYLTPNNKETRPARKINFDEIDISPLGQQCTYHYLPEDTSDAVLFKQTAFKSHWNLTKLLTVAVDNNVISF